MIKNVYKSSLQKNRKARFKQDYLNWKQHRQRQISSAASSVVCPNPKNQSGNYGPILKASEVGIALRTQEEHTEAAAKLAAQGPII